MIIIMSPLNDVHSLAVQSRLTQQLDKEATIIDAADYPGKWNIDMFVGQENGFILSNGGSIISSDQIEGVWLRRVQPPVISEKVVIREVRSFCQSETQDFLVGLLATFPNVVNKRSAEYTSSKKPYQLRVAAGIGLRVPDTLISTDPNRIRSFYERHSGNVIFKILTATKFQFTETRVLEREFLHYLDSAVFAPTIFQERIEARIHLRITVVDREMFCASVEPTRPHGLLDWRLDKDPIIRAAAVPDEVVEKLMMLCDALNLRYGAIDLILGKDGEYIFLEVNPGGQFLFIEIQTGQPISLAVAKSLTNDGKVPRQGRQSTIPAGEE
jgi:glutathione synthase/RimK-type ligase-like ATP-grasp enzyme